MMPISILLQEAANGVSPLVSLGVGGSIAALVLSLWRQDRKDSADRYERSVKENQDRYAKIAEDFRIIVQDNSRALTALSEKLDKLDVRDLVQENNSILTAVSEKMDSRCAPAELLLEVFKKGKPVNLEP